MKQLKDYLLDFGIFYENDYLEKYVDLIESNRDRPKEKYKTNKHHIVPQSYYKRYNIVVDNSDNNIINLLYKDHILAHYYLCLCLSDNKLRWDSEYAIRYLLNNPNFKASSEYEQERTLIESLDKYQLLHEELLQHIGDMHRGKTLSASTRQKMSKARKGIKLAELTRQKISKARLGIKLAESTKKKLSEINTGKVLSDSTKKKISDNAKTNLNYGFKGHTHKEDSKKKLSEKAIAQWSSESNRVEQSQRQKDRKFHWYTNGVDNIQVNEGDPVPEYYYRGKSVSESTKQKLRESHIGKEAWNKGKSLSEQHKANLRKPKRKKDNQNEYLFSMVH